MGLLTFTVKPNIPPKLAPLEELAHNLWISWNYDAIMLFMRVDYDAWLASRQNPARMLGLVPQKRLEEVASDDSFLAALEVVHAKFRRYLAAERWYREKASQSPGAGGEHAATNDPASRQVIAYFSMEYGIDVSLPVYSGGLGVLSGDHLKTASDLGLPLVGVGLLYRQGYFQQYLNVDGFQQESYPENDWYNMPVRRCLKASGEPVSVTVELAGERLVAWVWEVKVGRVPLYLLDANILDNPPHVREVTGSLYGGDRENRIRQEILLGMGGIRALRALGITPAVAHMNEGHSAFLGIERIREFMRAHRVSFAEALQAVWATSVFTTHTPVPAGNERFAPSLVEKYFKPLSQELGISWREFLDLGRERPGDEAEDFCLTVLALRLSAYANAVSRLHGEVSRRMWRSIWPAIPMAEVPVGHVSNGVHPRTWITHDLVDLLDRYLGPDFNDDPTNLAIWDRLDRVSDEELWRTHERRRERMVAFARMRLREQMVRRGATAAELAACEDALSPYALTISFARRFASYKRADLLLADRDRLVRLLTDRERPLQLIFSGKAHPHDLAGKEIIKRITHFASDPRVRSRIVFLEDYDLTIARYLVSGSDLWLNTPRRPMEASGTSGMKAALNGVLNLSVLDGWWSEAYDTEIGWAVGRGEQYEDERLGDEIEGKALFDLLEREIVPQFYERGMDGLPRDWIRRMKASMREVGKRFSSHRMLMEYTSRYYLPGLAAYEAFGEREGALARELAAYLTKVRASWPMVQVEELSSPTPSNVQVGDRIQVKVKVALAGLRPEELAVELYFGPLSSQGEITSPHRLEMNACGAEAKSTFYCTEVVAEATGRQGFTVRLLPKHAALVHPMLPGLIKWG